jgi:putative transposase
MRTPVQRAPRRRANRTCLPSDIIAYVVFCRLRYRLTLRDLTELLLLRGIEVSHATVRE